MTFPSPRLQKRPDLLSAHNETIHNNLSIHRGPIQFCSSASQLQVRDEEQLEDSKSGAAVRSVLAWMA